MAFNSAREMARKQGTATRSSRPAKRRTAANQRRTGRDPQGLAAVLDGMVSERGWTPAVAGGNAEDHWASLAGIEMAAHTTAVAFRADVRRLDVIVDSPAWAFQVRLQTQTLLTAFAEVLGPGTVLAIKADSQGTSRAASLRQTAPPATHLPREAPAPQPRPTDIQDLATPEYHQVRAAIQAGRQAARTGSPASSSARPSPLQLTT
jgi:predicted nucleic acid-binding Zn ribbon protein